MHRWMIWMLAGWMFAGGIPRTMADDAAPGTPPLARFDDEVAVFRRVLRQYCAIVQQMMGESELDPAKQQKGLLLLAQARPLWTAIQVRYADLPPAEYSADRTFKARLRDIDNAADDMHRALEAGDAQRSMLACGFACGLFVRMHEENGLSYALDKLFHLRQDIRTTMAVMRGKGIEAVRPRLPDLLQKRDIVLLAFPPFPPGHDQASTYAAAVDELSRAMDRLAMAVAAGDSTQVEQILANGLKLVNKPYGIAL